MLIILWLSFYTLRGCSLLSVKCSKPPLECSNINDDGDSLDCVLVDLALAPDACFRRDLRGTQILRPSCPSHSRTTRNCVILVVSLEITRLNTVDRTATITVQLRILLHPRFELATHPSSVCHCCDSLYLKGFELTSASAGRGDRARGHLGGSQ